MRVDANQIHEHVPRGLLVDPYGEGINHSTENSLHFRVDRLEQSWARQSKHPFHLRAAEPCDYMRLPAANASKTLLMNTFR